MEHIIPCILHATMNLTRAFLGHFMSDTADNEKFEKEIEDVLVTKMKFRLPEPENPKEGLSSRVKRAKFQRTHYLTILEKFQMLFSVARRFMESKKYEKVKANESYHRPMPFGMISRSCWRCRVATFLLRKCGGVRRQKRSVESLWSSMGKKV